MLEDETWIEELETYFPALKILLSSKQLSPEARGVAISYAIAGRVLSGQEQKIFQDEVEPLLKSIDQSFVPVFFEEGKSASKTLSKLDAREVSYRFDLEEDVSWKASMTSGRFFSDEMLLKFGVNLRNDLQVIHEVEWAWALTLCRAFDFFEKDIIHKIVDRKNQIVPSRSTRLLIEEEVKHRKLFKRLGKLLEEMHPEFLPEFNLCYKDPVGFELPLNERNDLDVRKHQYIIWLYTIFFEDFTVYLHEGLADSSDPIQKTWLSAHKCHRQEEEEHLRTDEGYLELCGLSPLERRFLSKEFFLAVGRNYLDFFGLGSAKRFLEMRHKQKNFKCLESEELKDLSFYQDILLHPLFKNTRFWAPVIQGLEVSSLETRTQKLDIPQHENLVTRLSISAQKFPEHGLHIQNKSGELQLWSYKNLHEEAHGLAGKLSHLLSNRQYVLLYFPDIKSTILGFWAALISGRIPVVMAHTGKLSIHNEETKRLIGALNTLKSTSLLTDRFNKTELDDFLTDYDLPVIALEDVESLAPVNNQDRELDWDMPALIQFSSGSTGDPKGIVLSHKNIIANALQMTTSRPSTSNDKFLNWMPLHHDMGLIGFHLSPLIIGANQIHLLPVQFLKNPGLLPKLISKHGITHTGMTNTALKSLIGWMHAKERETYDFSTLKSMIIGAEPIDVKVLDELFKLLSHMGLKKEALAPAFGMAEGALGITFHEDQKTYRSHAFHRETLSPGRIVEKLRKHDTFGVHIVCLGKPVLGLELQILNDQGIVLPEGQVGYLSMRGPNVSKAYWGKTGYVESLDSNGWYRTQDIGLMLDSSFYSIGRLQELFFHSGKNYYLNDLDYLIEGLPEVRTGGAATIISLGSGQQDGDLVLFVDLNFSLSQDTETILKKIHSQVYQKSGVSIGKLVSLPRRNFIRTTSGKIKRLDMYEAYVHGLWGKLESFIPERKAIKFKKVEVSNTKELASKIALIWSSVLEVEITNMHWDTSFSGMGGTSLKAVHIHNALEELMGKPLSPSLLLSMNTINELARELTEESIFSAQKEKSSVCTPVQVGFQKQDESMAIVGVGLRYPGVSTLKELATNLMEGKRNFAPLSDRRCELIGLAPGAKRPYGSFLEEIELFDPEPFLISDKLATEMDPQHRLLLEMTLEALGKTRLTSGKVGVFASSGVNEYAELIRSNRSLNEESIIGALRNMLSAQISRTFRFRGPALSVDTACSSSLYAVHLACQSLRLGECDAAIAGGVQINLTSMSFDYFRAAGLLKEGEYPAPFGDKSGGLVPGEGGGVIVLKRYSDAVRDRDYIYGVIQSTGVNNDGPSLSGTAPNPTGQIELLQEIYQNKNYPISELNYFEAHAAGTAIGDAIEVSALQTAFEELNGDEQVRIPIGSAKLNFGHTLSASGITSLLKVLACLESQSLPSSVKGYAPTSRINFGSGNFYPLEKVTSWKRGKRIRRAGINSLGLGGTNVHVLLEEAPSAPAALPHKFPLLLSVGGASERHYEQRFLTMRKRADLKSLSSSSFLSDQFATYRRFFWNALPEENENEILPKIPKVKPRITFVYPGPGCQYLGMGRFLYESSPVFKMALDECHVKLVGLGFNLLSHLFDEKFEASLMLIENSQPAVFSFSYAMSKFLEDLGIRPDLVIGHSAGEFAAAVHAGLMDLDIALECILLRGKLMAEAPIGGMAVVHLSHEELAPYLSSTHGQITFAAYNSPEQTTLSGDCGKLDILIEELKRAGHEASRLDISCAAHSQSMHEASIKLRKHLLNYSWAKGRIPFLSTLDVQVKEKLTAEHWGQQLEQPVQFSLAIETAISMGTNIFLELAPTSGLTHCISAIDKNENRALKIALMRRGQESLELTLVALNELYKNGVDLRFEGMLYESTLRDSLPPEFLRKKYWIPVQTIKSEVSLEKENAYQLNADEIGVINDHLIQGRATAPFGLLMDILVHVKGGARAFAVTDLIFMRSLFLNESSLVSFTQTQDLIEIHSNGLLLAQARIEKAPKRTTESLNLKTIKERCIENYDASGLYSRRNESGLQIGEGLRAIKEIRKGDGELLVYLKATTTAAHGHQVQPALIDSAMQATAALFPKSMQGQLYLGFGIEKWELWKPIQNSTVVYIRLDKATSVEGMLSFVLFFCDAEGIILSQMTNFSVRKLARPDVKPQSVDMKEFKEVKNVEEKSESGPLEEMVFGIFSKHLNRTIGRAETDELFSALGIDSLKAVRIANEIQKQSNVKLPATLLFEAPNLRLLLKLLKKRMSK